MTANINGLVLAGGKSTRMGNDKGAIQYHQKPQRLYLYELLSKYCNQVYLSCREEQIPTFEENHPYNYIFDDPATGKGGPITGILSAFQKKTAMAWLVVACDMPYLDDEAIAFLIQERDASKMATVYQNPENQLPEPLIAIWEPESNDIITDFTSKGINCPRKILINSDVKLITAFRPEILANINYKEEYEQLVRNLKN